MAMAKKNIPVSPPHTPQSFVTSVIYKSHHSKLSFCFLMLHSGPTISHTAWASCFLWEAQSLHHVSCTVNTQRTSAGSREKHSIPSFAVTGSPCWEGCPEEEVLFIFSRRNVGREGGFQYEVEHCCFETASLLISLPTEGQVWKHCVYDSCG